MGEDIPPEKPESEWGSDCSDCLPNSTPKFLAVMAPGVSCECYWYEQFGLCGSKVMVPTGCGNIICEQDEMNPCRWFGNYFGYGGEGRDYWYTPPRYPPCEADCSGDYASAVLPCNAVVEKINADWLYVEVVTGVCIYMGNIPVTPNTCAAGSGIISLTNEAEGCTCDIGLVNVTEL